MRKVDLSNLPRKRNKIDWINSKGYVIPFEYDEIKGELKILKYINNCRKLLVEFNNTKNIILINSIIKCNLGRILNKTTSNFKLKIGDKLDNENYSITIIDMFYRKMKSQNNKYYKYKCNKCGFESNRIEHKIINGNISCGRCSLKEEIIKNTNPEIIKYFKNEKDCELYSKGTHTKIIFKCPDCGYEFYDTIPKVIKGFSCKRCGNKNSYPERFMINLLTQLNVEFETEYSPEWCKYEYKNKLRQGRYDFYIPSENLIIEMDGAFHYIDNKMDNTKSKEIKCIDYKKDKLAKDNGLDVIRINCNYSNIINRFKMIKNNILHSKLNKIFKFNNIDWYKILLNCEDKELFYICDYWNNNYYTKTTYDLSNELNMDRNKIYNYLKIGTEINLLKIPYDGINEKIKAIKLKEQDENNSNYKDIYMYNNLTKELICCGKFQKDIGEWLSKNGYYNTTEQAKKMVNYIIKKKNGIHTFNNGLNVLITYSKMEV